MKKIITLSISLLINVAIYAQVPGGVQIVNDPTNLAKIKEMVKSGEETVASMNKQLKYIEEAKEQVDKVNSFVKKATATKKAIQNAERLASTITKAQSDIAKLNLDADALTSYSQSLDNLYSSILESVSDLTTVLTDGSLKMSDAERLSIIKEKQEELAYKEWKIKQQVERAQKASGRKAVLNILSNGSR